MAIAIVYIGEKRFQRVTSENHKKMINELSKDFEIKVYDFLKDGPNPKCPYKLSGAIQLWDFLMANDAVPEEIVIKVRTDVWFTDTSINILKSRIRKVINKELDIAYLGLDLRNHYDKEIATMTLDVGTKSKCTDFVIIVRKEQIRSSKDCIQLYTDNNQEKSGNKAFKALILPNTKYESTSCQMYLIRKEFQNPNNFDIINFWVQEYRKTVEAREWIAKNKEIVNAF